MCQINVDAVCEEISGLDITREADGFTVRLGSRSFTLQDATGFEFRPQSPMIVERLYLGSEDGKGCSCNITFLRPRRVRLSGAAPRCYVYID